MSETMPHPDEVVAPAPQPWDPFQLMDRMDEEALRKELEGVAGTDLVYVVKEGGQEVVGLSKTGVDECCMALVSQGQVIREEDLQYEVIGEGEDREALFKVKAARFAVSPAGQEVRLDQVIGVKRQPLYYEPAQLDLDARVPSKKYKGRTYRELLAIRRGPGLPRLDGGELRRAGDPRLRPPDPGGRGDQRPARAPAQSALVRGRRHEGGAQRAVPPHPGQRARADHRDRAAGRPGARGRGTGRRAPRRLESPPTRGTSRRASAAAASPARSRSRRSWRAPGPMRPPRSR